MTFILNIIDDAGRRRPLPRHPQTGSALPHADPDRRGHQANREKAIKDSEETIKEITEKREAAHKAMDDKIDEVEARTDLKELEKEVLLEQTRRTEQQKLDAEAEALASQQKRQRERRSISIATRKSARCRIVTRCSPS